MSPYSPPRLDRLRPTELDESQRELYDTIAGGPRAAGPQHFRLVDDDGCLEGPFNAFLLQPELGDRVQALGSAIRYSTSLPARMREIAILVVAAAWHSEFEQYAHEAIGRAAGLTDAELAAIREGPAGETTTNWPDGDDLRLVTIVRSLAVDGDLDDDAYRDAAERYGDAGLFELVTLVGYYAAIALQLRVFRVVSNVGATDATDATETTPTPTPNTPTQ